MTTQVPPSSAAAEMATTEVAAAATVAAATAVEGETTATTGAREVAAAPPPSGPRAQRPGGSVPQTRWTTTTAPRQGCTVPSGPYSLCTRASDVARR